jgi:hypothetical protein
MSMMMNKTLEYIWKNTHCSSIKINIYHYNVTKTVNDEQKTVMEGNPGLK